MQMQDYIDQYVVIELETYDELHARVMQRLDIFGAYRYLHNKSKEDIKDFTTSDVMNILSGLYSTQRPNVMESLTELLHSDGGLKYFKGIFNQLKKRKWDIDLFHMEQKQQLQMFKRHTGNYKLALGKNTISQIAHFCDPHMYPISNTKSQKVIQHLLNTNVDNNYSEFEHIANPICEGLQKKCEQVFEQPLNSLFEPYKYVVMDDFMEYVYERI